MRARCVSRPTPGSCTRRSTFYRAITRHETCARLRSTVNPCVSTHFFSGFTTRGGLRLFFPFRGVVCVDAAGVASLVTSNVSMTTRATCTRPSSVSRCALSPSGERSRASRPRDLDRLRLSRRDDVAVVSAAVPSDVISSLSLCVAVTSRLRERRFKEDFLPLGLS